MDTLTADGAARWIAETFDGLVERASYGERAFFYNPGAVLKNGVYFATLKERDGPNDRASKLDRPGVWRLNFGMAGNDFTERFGARPARPARGAVVAGPWDFSATGQLTTHPVYGWMGWVAIVCPTADDLNALRPLLQASHAKAAAAFAKRTRAA